MPDEKNPAAVQLGKLAAKKRGTQGMAEAGRRGGLRKAANRKNAPEDINFIHPDADKRNYERDLKRQERKRRGDA